MMGRVFVDTNILVYAHDLDAGFKYEMASKAVSELWENRNGLISTQVLQEFYITLTKKIPRPLTGNTVRGILMSYSSWEIVLNDPKLIFQASEIEEANHISFWDALIVSAAFSGNASVILTEDLNHGQYIEGILIKNPFIP
ncbi:MAG: PIN domain-containing protein [Proteobacteria bacterium]|nr:PIN domain-containing protein [Pseudomonadota bacterium]MBU4469769.1 PIN domain-containing protein [Pseudomonadota bacterium]MCG2753004.1 PIN domain-containing protein [Desulfobacteraceae bacterium]